LLNTFGIILDNRKLFERIFKYEEAERNFEFTYFVKGKPRSIKHPKGEKKFNFFDLLYQYYQRIFSFKYNEGKKVFLKDFSDSLYDLTGLPIISIDFKYEIRTSKILLDLKNLVYNTNKLCILVNEEDHSSTQFAYAILTTYELNELIRFQDYTFKAEKSKNLDDVTNYSKNIIEFNSVLFKLRPLSEKHILDTGYSLRVLMDSDRDINFINELYPDKDVNTFSWININEIPSRFTKLLILEYLKYEQQINGKFIKCLRQDNIIEFKSKWIYSFNITNDNAEVTIGIHQPSINYSTITSYLYIGLVVLKSNSPFLTFCDYLHLKDCRQGFLKLKLPKGCYVVVPVTTGFYFEGQESNPKFEDINLFEKKMDIKKNKMVEDFSQEAKHVLDVLKT
jgi:hypothetical protein